jgi:large subunit ribosomal protein L24
MKIKLEDHVVVIAGKDKGKKGKVTKLDNVHNKVIVEKLNLKTKHVKRKGDRPGERIKFEAPIHASNVMVICPSCDKRTRVMYKKLETGKKERVCKKCKETLDKKKKLKK